jgi:hypothetical protein
MYYIICINSKDGMWFFWTLGVMISLQKIFSDTGIWNQGLMVAQQVHYHLNQAFGIRYLQDSGLPTMCSSWLGTGNLLISDSQVSRITVVSHQRPSP